MCSAAAAFVPVMPVCRLGWIKRLVLSVLGAWAGWYCFWLAGWVAGNWKVVASAAVNRQGSRASSMWYVACSQVWLPTGAISMARVRVRSRGGVRCEYVGLRAVVLSGLAVFRLLNLGRVATAHTTTYPYPQTDAPKPRPSTGRACSSSCPGVSANMYNGSAAAGAANLKR